MKAIHWAALAAVTGLTAGCINKTQVPAATTAAPAPNQEKQIMIIIKTSLGDIKAELYDQKAPETVKNFLSYVDDKHFNGTIFHRVIPGFMIQGGGFTEALAQKPTKPPVVNEAFNGLKNTRGTLAMARTPDVNSATCQFFINVANNGPLDHTAKTPRGFGYCVFGKVTEGMDVVDKIVAVKTGSRGPHDDVPVEAVVIRSIERLP